MDGFSVDGSIECPRVIARSFGCCRAAGVQRQMAVIQLSRRQQPAQKTASTIIVTPGVLTICDVDLSGVRIRIEALKLLIQ